jgi:DNA invertase Pin-like site-specific DNA recombinase
MTKKKPLSLEAYLYLRVSGLEQLKGYGLERQEELCRKHAALAGYQVVGVYADSHTGTDEDRPEFIAMLAAMMANGVKTVIVESLDRLARLIEVQSILLAKMSAEGLTLIAANTGMDITESMKGDPMRKALVRMQGVFAELDRDLIVQKLRKGRDAASKKLGRRCEGPKPFGLDAALPGEAVTVERIKALRRQRPRPSLQKIADALNAEPTLYPTRKGARWSKMTVKNVIDRV